MIETLNRTGLPLIQEKAASSTASATSGVLGQQDFLTLMTTQMKNQDPLKPMENGEFLAQMAQFSTVAGIDRVNDTLSGLAGGMRDFRMATATNLLGHKVLVPSNIARPDEDGAVHGMVELESDAENVIVTYADATTGEILHSEDLGRQPAGLVGFGWEGVPEEFALARQSLRVGVTVIGEDGSALEIGPSVYARVVSAATAGYGSDDITLQVEDYGALNALEVEAFR